MPATGPGINLLPKDKFSQSLGGKILTWALTVGRYIVIATELVVVLAFLFRFKYDMELANIRDQIKENQQIITSFQDMESQFRYLQNRTNAVKDITVKAMLKNSIYEHVGRNTPPDVFFDNLHIDNNSLSLKGVAMSDVGLVTLLAAIKKDPAFKQASLDSLSSKGELDPQLQFSLNATLNKL